MTITYKSELEVATTAVEMGLANDSILTEEVLKVAEKAFVEAAYQLHKRYLDFSDIKQHLTSAVKEALKQYQPVQESKEIRVVVDSKVVENYEQEWFFNLEVVETTKVLSGLSHRYFFPRD